MKIYIVSHKKVDLPKLDDIYNVLTVGKGNYEEKCKEYLHDNTGINISEKNENYCELTGLYWIWKNSKEDIVGLCHYRRFLSKSSLSNSEKYFLSEKDIRKKLDNEYDIILPKPKRYRGKIISNKSNAPSEKDMVYVKDSISRIYPDYIETYDKFIRENKSSMCNVIICKKEIFDEYCKWLFNILFDVEKNMPLESYIDDPYRKRMFGFISERLLNVWVMKNKYKIKNYNLINLDENLSRKIIEKFKNILYYFFHN